MSDDGTFTCFRCGGTFERNRSDQLYVAPPPEEDQSMGSLCYECWLLFMEWATGQRILFETERDMTP